jgi:acetyltransferase-like isoleucine patch superfamily enzyme
MYTLDKAGYFLRILARNPSELWRIFRIGLTTARFRYLSRCVGPGSVVGVGTEVVNSANVRMGARVLLQDYVYIRAGAEGRVTIADRVAINSFCRIFGHGSVTVGEDTQIGPGSLITTTDHDYGDSLQTRYKPVAIGKRVWIGANVTVLPGVTIGDGAVIGAGAVVTQDIPAWVVAVGVPARVVRAVCEPARLPEEASADGSSD